MNIIITKKIKCKELKKNENNNLFQKEKGVHGITAMFIVRVLYMKKLYFLISNYLSYFYDWFLFSYFILNTVKLRVIIFLDFFYFFFKIH